MYLLAKAVSKYVRVSPRKARLVADLIRGVSAQEARIRLRNSKRRAGAMLEETLHSAIANAADKLGVAEAELFVSQVFVDAGPVLKRAKSRSRGNKVPVMKRTSHFTVCVEPVQGRAIK